MCQKALRILAVIILSILVFPLVVSAGSTDTITITATGSDSTAAPGIVIDFTATLDSVNDSWAIIDVTWANPAYTDTVTLVRRIDRYPENDTDGEVLYTDGDDESYRDIVEGVEQVYYAIWAYNEYGQSPIQTTDVQVVSNMVNAILLIGMLFVGLTLSIVGYQYKKIPIVVIAALLWLGTGAWSFTQVVNDYDQYFFIGCIGLLMGIVSALEPFLWIVSEKPNKLSSWELEEDINKRHSDELRNAMERIRRRKSI